MPGSRVLIPAASHLRPYTQGHVSSLCGMYSVLNAIQLALYPHYRLSRSELKTLFIHGVEHLDGIGILPSVLRTGIEEDAWLVLGQTILDRSHELTGIRLCRDFILRRRSRLTSRKALASIKYHLRLGRPVMVTLWGAYDHATVLVGYDDSKLILFDSSGFHWIGLRGVGLEYPQSPKRHQITSSAVAALSSSLGA